MCIICPSLTQQSKAAVLHLNKAGLQGFPKTAIPQEHKPICRQKATSIEFLIQCACRMMMPSYKHYREISIKRTHYKANTSIRRAV